MINILRKRIGQLVQGDDGAALVITLALFMMMYISCAGVFAIGQTVKDKMVLQNAADAAAYSAAIVQADTLSRIAALNREMALTYKTMVCRQMDYIVCKWLQDASTMYVATEGISDLNANAGHVSPLDASHSGAPVDSAGYATQADELLERILADSSVISDLNTAVINLLENYKVRVTSVVEDVLAANLPDWYLRDCYWNIKLSGYSDWARVMGGDEEDQFLDFVHKSTSEYGNSYSEWFDIASELRHECAGNFFISHWLTEHKTIHHSYSHESLNSDFSGVVAAKPYVLKPEFYKDPPAGADDEPFVRKGAISVGVAKYNRNPWEGLVLTGSGGRTRGLYEVFQPLIGAISWTWAVASAQAGYIDSRKDGIDRKKSYEDDRDYHVDWDDDDKWNLRTDNWDAVYVPVRQSFTSGGFESWIKGEDGDWKPLASVDVRAKDLPDYNLGNMNEALPSMHSSGVGAKLLWGESPDGTHFIDKVYH